MRQTPKRITMLMAAVLLLGIAGCHPAGIGNVVEPDGTTSVAPPNGADACPGGACAAPPGEVAVGGEVAPPAEGDDAPALHGEAPSVEDAAPPPDAPPQGVADVAPVQIVLGGMNLGTCKISFSAETCDYALSAIGGHGTYAWEILGTPEGVRVEPQGDGATALVKVHSWQKGPMMFTLVASDEEDPSNQDSQPYRVTFVGDDDKVSPK